MIVLKGLPFCCFVVSVLIFVLAVTTHAQEQVLPQKKVADAEIADLLQKAKEAYQRSDSSARYLALSALKLARQRGDFSNQGKAYTRLGWIASQQAELYTATLFADSAMTCFKTAHDEKGIALCQNLFANIFINFDDRKEAEKRYRLALASLEKINDTSGRIAVLNNLGYLCIEDKRWNEGISWLKIALPLAISQRDSMQEARIKTNMGEAFFHLKEYQQAALLFSDAYRTRRYLPGAAGETLTWLIAAAQEMEANPSLKTAGEKALAKWHFQNIEQALDSVLVLAKLTENDPGLMHQIMKVRVRQAALAGEFEKAMLLEQQRHDFLDSTKLNNLNLAAFASLQQRLESERQHSRILDLEKQKVLAQAAILKQTRLRNGLLALMLVLVVIGYALFWVYQHKLRARQLENQLQQQKMLDLEKQQELVGLHAAFKAQEQERERFARDLHDHLGSLLSALKLHFHRITRKQALLSNQDMATLTDLLEEAHTETRKLAYEIMPSSLSRLGLVKALEELCSRMGALVPFLVSFRYFGKETRLKEEKEVLLYRICQEALQNVERHAQATETLVQLTHTGQTLLLSIEDNGQGFDQEIAQKGLGLQSIASRARQLNGVLSIDSKPGKGTLIQVEVFLD